MGSAVDGGGGRLPARRAAMPTLRGGAHAALGSGGLRPDVQLAAAALGVAGLSCSPAGCAARGVAGLSCSPAGCAAEGVAGLSCASANRAVGGVRCTLLASPGRLMRAAARGAAGA
eukprot:365277-Chlamydomonas_euryale.AAC.29